MVLPQNIIIVEDEVITQRYLQDIFTQQHIQVVGCFSSAVETMKHLKNLKCDMLLMDINIKGPVDGIQLAREILKTYSIPIVFITAHNDDETLDEILELAPYGFITKPFSSKEVVVAIQIAYKRYLVHRELSTLKEKGEVNTIVINDSYSYLKKQSTLYYEGSVVKLNQKQSSLIRILVENINHTVSCDTLELSLWENGKVAASALRTLVYSVRKTLHDIPIVSHSKIGYMLKSSKTKAEHD